MIDFGACLNDFKSTDLDPRELILLYKSLLASNPDVLKRHFTTAEFGYDLKKIIDQYKLENNRPNVNTEQEILKSKKVVAAILEHKNQKFTSELNKNANKTIKFQYSKFSPFSHLIKPDRSGAGVLLKDVTAFLQTNLIKIYVE